MEIAGLGNNLISSQPEKTLPDKLGSSFQQVLNNAVNKKSSKQPEQSNEDKNDLKPVEALLSFLKNNDITQITEGNQGIVGYQANSQTDRLKMVKNLLGISDQKWSEIISELEGRINEKLQNQDPNYVLIEGLLGLNMNASLAVLNENGQQLLTGLNKNGQQLLAGLNENTILFLKAAKVYSLLSNQELPSQQFLSGLLDSAKNQLQTAVQNSQAQSKQTYLLNTFSQLVSDIKDQTAGSSSESNQSKAVNKLTDWVGNSPFLQQMSKPEQLVVMTGGTGKSVSVNDLIQQFETILSKSQFSKTGGVQKLFIKLNPENLGSINIELIQKNQLITARILTTTEAAKEALESHLHNLKHAFEAQNIKVDNVEIGQQQSSQSQQEDLLNRDQRNSQEHPHPQDQQQETSENEDTTGGFILTLEEAILNQEV